MHYSRRTSMFISRDQLVILSKVAENKQHKEGDSKEVEADAKEDLIPDKETTRVKPNVIEKPQDTEHKTELTAEQPAKPAQPGIVLKGKKKDRLGAIRSEYFPLKEKGDETWAAIRDMYGIEDVEYLIKTSGSVTTYTHPTTATTRCFWSTMVSTTS